MKTRLIRQFANVFLMLLAITASFSGLAAAETQTERHRVHAGLAADHSGHNQHGGHQMNMLAMVMNDNSDSLPVGCDDVSEDVAFTVRAGTKHALHREGKLFGYSQHVWQIKPCARVTITFQNDDDVRHQWMLHGLPDYLYRQGMFHMELNGRGETSGSFIVPPEDKTYLVHCDISQHTEKGMKAQLVVGNGSGDLDNIPRLAVARLAESK